MTYNWLVDAGTIFGLIGMVPQIYLVIKNRDTLKDLSLTGYIIFFFSILCFTVYAWINKIWVAFAIDVFQCIYALSIVLLVYRSHRRTV